MTKHLRFLFVMLLAMIWSAGWAAQKTETITIADYVPSSSSKEITAEAPLSQNGFKIYIEKQSKNTPGLYKKGKNLRFYEKDILHIESSNGDITSVEFTVTSVTDFSIKGMSSNIWSGTPSASLSFTGSNTNKITVIKITYTDSSSSAKTDTKVSFSENSGKTFTFTEGEYSDDTFTTPTATETNGVAGTVAYSSSNATAISVDASTGALTFNGYGKATITATFTPNDTEKYAESTDSYIVENNQKVDESVILFSADAESFESIKGNVSYDTNKGNFDFVATNGKNYTFNVQRALKDKGRLQLNDSTVTSPSFPDFTKGYKVTVEYSMSSSKGSLTLSSGSNLVTGSNTQTKITLKVQNSSPFVIEKNSGTAAYIIKIEIIPNKVDETTVISLDENSESNTIEAKTGVNVTLNRPMKIGRWNTFCVPFSIDANQVTSQFGEGTQIAEYSVSKSKDDLIDFATVQSNAIVAGKAYLVKPTKVAATEGYTFSNVNITALEPTKEENVDNDAIDFRGIYNPTDITVGLPANTFAAGIVGNVVKKAVSDSKMKGFRAFFIIPEGTGAQSSYMLKIDGTATSINSINGADVVVNAPVYNLQGQRVDGNNLTPGIYVKAGKKFVVK